MNSVVQDVEHYIDSTVRTHKHAVPIDLVALERRAGGRVSATAVVWTTVVWAGFRTRRSRRWREHWSRSVLQFLERVVQDTTTQRRWPEDKNSRLRRPTTKMLAHRFVLRSFMVSHIRVEQN